MRDVVFFSNKCANCKEFLNTFLQMPFKDSFCYISVDKRKDDDLIKILEVEFVPTIFVSGNMLVGSQAFLWLDKQIAPAAQQVPQESHHQMLPQHQVPQHQVPQHQTPQHQLHQAPQHRAREPAGAVIEEFSVQPLGGDFSGYASITDAHMEAGPMTRLPAPEHVRKGEKIDEKSMSEMLTQLNEQRKQSVPLSLSEQKAQHAAMQDRYA